MRWGRWPPQVAGLRQLHKADQIGQGYTVVGFGSQCVPQMLTLALAMHDAAFVLSARPSAAPGNPEGAGPRWRVRVGVARGSVVTGGSVVSGGGATSLVGR